MMQSVVGVEPNFGNQQVRRARREDVHGGRHVVPRSASHIFVGELREFVACRTVVVDD
jgi:hypothetical protein